MRSAARSRVTSRTKTTRPGRPAARARWGRRLQSTVRGRGPPHVDVGRGPGDAQGRRRPPTASRNASGSSQALREGVEHLGRGLPTCAAGSTPNSSPARRPIMRQRPSPSNTMRPSSAASSTVRNAACRKLLHSGSSPDIPGIVLRPGAICPILLGADAAQVAPLPSLLAMPFALAARHRAVVARSARRSPPRRRSATPSSSTPLVDGHREAPGAREPPSSGPCSCSRSSWSGGCRCCSSRRPARSRSLQRRAPRLRLLERMDRSHVSLLLMPLVAFKIALRDALLRAAGGAARHGIPGRREEAMAAARGLTVFRGRERPARLDRWARRRHRRLRRRRRRGRARACARGPGSRSSSSRRATGCAPSEYGSAHARRARSRRCWREAGMSAAVGLGDTPFISVLQGKCVGGSSVLTGGVCFRIPDEVLHEWSHDLGLAHDDARGRRRALPRGRAGGPRRDRPRRDALAQHGALRRGRRAGSASP